MSFMDDQISCLKRSIVRLGLLYNSEKTIFENTNFVKVQSYYKSCFLIEQDLKLHRIGSCFFFLLLILSFLSEDILIVYLVLQSDRYLSGVNFIKVFMRSFYAHRSQKCKKLLDFTVFFARLGSEGVKAACKMLLKLTLII